MILGAVNGVDAVIIAVLLMKLYVFTTTTIMTIIIIIRINETGNYHTVLMVHTVIRITQTQSKCRQLRGLLVKLQEEQCDTFRAWASDTELCPVNKCRLGTVLSDQIKADQK